MQEKNGGTKWHRNKLSPKHDLMEPNRKSLSELYVIYHFYIQNFKLSDHFYSFNNKQCQLHLPLPNNRFHSGIIPQVLLSHQKYGRVKTCGPQVATSLSHQEPCFPYGDMKRFCNILHEEMVSDLRSNNEVSSLSTLWAPRILPHVSIHCLLDAWWPATELLFSVYYPLGMNKRIVCRPAWRGCDMVWKGTEGGGEIKWRQKR